MKQDNLCTRECYGLLKAHSLSSHGILSNAQCKTHCVLYKPRIYNSYPMDPNSHSLLVSFQRIYHPPLSKPNAFMPKGMDD